VESSDDDKENKEKDGVSQSGTCGTCVMSAGCCGQLASMCAFVCAFI
jgi:hypothetical protein